MKFIILKTEKEMEDLDQSNLCSTSQAPALVITPDHVYLITNQTKFSQLCSNREKYSLPDDKVEISRALIILLQ